MASLGRSASLLCIPALQSPAPGALLGTAALLCSLGVLPRVQQAPLLNIPAVYLCAPVLLLLCMPISKVCTMLPFIPALHAALPIPHQCSASLVCLCLGAPAPCICCVALPGQMCSQVTLHMQSLQQY